MILYIGIRQIKCLLGSLVALVIFDGLITQFLVSNGLAHEINPFLANIVGEHSFMIIKATGAFLCAIILWDIYRKWSKLGDSPCLRELMNSVSSEEK